MFSLLFLAVLCASCLAKPALVHYSYSRAVGSGGGISFSTEGEGRITAVRVWETPSAYITGYDYIWSARIGHIVGDTHELDLYDGEVIVQVSGKYQSNYIYQLIFVTSRGRSLIVGQPTQSSFNFYPTHVDGELRMLSGRYTSSLHFTVVYMDEDNSTAIST